MTSNVRMILNEVNARIKLAEAKTAEDPSNFDAFPGAENDKPVAAETKKPDPEVKDEGPASRTEASGAEPGSDDKVNQDHLYEADQPILTPEKKPTDSADANAKVAESKEQNPEVTKIASEIMSVIKDALTKKAQEAKPAEEKKAEEKDAKCGKKSEVCTNPADCKTSECGKKSEGCKNPADCKTSECSKKSEGCKGSAKADSIVKKVKDAICKKAAEKRAKDEQISLGKKILDKIAEARQAKIEKEAGAHDALTLLKAASEYNRGANDAKALIQKLAQALEESAASGDATTEDGAVAPEAAGAADAEAAIADAAMAADAEGSDDQVTPEEVAQAVTELVNEGQISDAEAATLVEQLGGGEEASGEVSEEDLANGIIQGLESGAISEEEAQQLVPELVVAGADDDLKEEVSEDANAANAAAADASADANAAAEAAGAADAASAIEDVKKAEAELKKQASDEQIARYQKGFIQKCAEYGVDPQAVAKYIQAKVQAK